MTGTPIRSPDPRMSPVVRRSRTPLSFGLCAVVALLLYAGSPWFRDRIETLREHTWPIPTAEVPNGQVRTDDGLTVTVVPQH